MEELVRSAVLAWPQETRHLAALELLVVEDDPGDARLVALAVESGWDGAPARPRLRTVTSLGAARQALTERPVDCILLDLTLPDASGLEAVAVLSLAAPDAAIVVLTAARGETFAVPALGEGAHECVSKDDAGPEAIRCAIDRACERRAGARRRDEVRRMSMAILHTVEAPTVALDGSGRIVGCSDAWVRTARRHGASLATCGVGVNYLAVCGGAAGAMSEEAVEVAEGIRAVLNGTADRFTTDYPCPSQGVMRWFSVRVTPLGAIGGGAVVTHTDITDTKRAEEAMRFHEDVMPSATDAPAIFVLLDRDGNLLHLADHTREILGVPPDLVLDADVLSLVHARDRRRAEAALAAAVELREPQDILVRVRRMRGGWADLRLTFTSLLHEPGVEAVIATGDIVTDARRAAIADHLDSQLLDRLPAGVVVTDDAGIVVYCNERASLLLRRTTAEMLGEDFARNLGSTDAEREREVVRSLATIGRWEGEGEIVLPDGSVQELYCVTETVEAPTVPFNGSVTTLLDDSERRRLRASLAHQALHDDLTGLPNQTLFLDRAEQALARRDSERPLVAILRIGVDRFGIVNELAGRGAGEIVLEAVGHLLEATVGVTNTVGRLGGGDFVVCCEQLQREYDAVLVAEQLRAVLSQPFRFGGEEVLISVSVGITVGRLGDNRSAARLLSDAEVALHRAMERGRGCHEVFEPEMRASLDRRLRLTEGLRHAVERNELRLRYQPVVELTTGAIVGAEALLRWEHPELGMLSPDEFVGIAEDTGAILEIGAWVIDEAVAEAAAWRRAAPERQLGVAVNLSAHQMADRSLTAHVRAALDRHELDPVLLTLEITESVVMQDAAQAVLLLRDLRSLGVRISIDDFGTGYSSLAYLKRLPVDYLKIDRSFVSTMETEPEDTVIVEAVVRLAASLGLGAIAEGVERIEHAEALAAVGCRYAQGYLWSKPVSSKEFLRVHPVTPIAPYPGSAAMVPVEEPSDVASLIHHEIVSTLAVVHGNLGLLEAAQLDELQARALRSALRSTQRIDTLLETLADLRLLADGTTDV